MKVEVLQENLVKALGWVSRFVAVKPNLPILSKLLIKVVEGKLVLVATNMDTGVSVEVPAKILEEGSLAIPAKVLYEYVNLLAPGKIEITSSEMGLKLKSGTRKASISGENAGDFPELPKLESKEIFVVKTKALEQVVKLVGYSASTELTRPVLSALLLEFGSKSIKAVATDGYRLSILKNIKYEGEIKIEKILIPAGVMGEVERLARDVGSTLVTITYGGEQKSIVFDLGGAVIVSRLVEGEFPAYEKILPKESSVEVAFDRAEMMEAIKAASIFARDNAHIVRWVIGDKGITVSAQSSGLGEQESLVGAKQIKGEKGEIAFNSRFLIDLLASTTDGEVCFGMNEALEPGIFSSGDKGFNHVIMPVRIQQ